MTNEEIVTRLKRIADHAVHIPGEKPFVMSLDDGIAIHEAIEMLSQQTEYHGTEDMDGLYYCPICQQTTTAVKDGKCPKCGATMDELSTREQTEDAISRQAVDEAIYDYSRSCDVNYAQIMEYIDKIPSVNPQPKTDVLDKIRVEIEAKCCITVGRENDGAITLHDVFEIIDRYKAEVEPQESEGADADSD